MSEKKTAVNDIGPVQPEASPTKGLLKKKDSIISSASKKVTFEEPGANVETKYKYLFFTIQRVECLYNTGALDFHADP